MFISIMSTSVPLSFSAIRQYSSGVLPAIFAIITVFCCLSHGKSSLMNASTPGFWSPTAFKIPDGVSAILGGGLPSRRVGVIPLQEIPPSFSSG